MTWSTRPSSSSSSTKKFAVYDFDGEGEKVVKVSRKMSGKFLNPRKSRSSPISKYKFLEACKSLHFFISLSFHSFRFAFLILRWFCAVTRDSKPLSKTVIVDPINLDDEQGMDHSCTKLFALSQLLDYHFFLLSLNFYVNQKKKPNAHRWKFQRNR